MKKIHHKILKEKYFMMDKTQKCCSTVFVGQGCRLFLSLPWVHFSGTVEFKIFAQNIIEQNRHQHSNPVSAAPTALT